MGTLDCLIHISQPLKSLLQVSTCQKYNTAIKIELANHKYCKWCPKLMFHLPNPKKRFQTKNNNLTILKILIPLK